MKQVWQSEVLKKIPCQLTTDWLNTHAFFGVNTFPTAIELTALAAKSLPSFQYRFIEQVTTSSNDPREYYENIIAKQKRIPTRANNWHDFLNAVIWMQFPKSKALISDLHAHDIEKNGLHPRSGKRNRLTHFDECGLILVCNKDKLDSINPFVHALATHDWQTAFCKYQVLWHKDVLPIVFGHASLEMLLSPFIGLTAKWVVVSAHSDFFNASYHQQREQVDELLVEKLVTYDGFISPDILSPIPVLGIPNWYKDQNDNFYQNKDYFRPQRQGVALTKQYPVK